jgi:hypothetical protein
MPILTLNTTTPAGSLALARNRRLLEVAEGEPSLTHAARLPGGILDLPARHHLTCGDLDLYGVAVGPGADRPSHDPAAGLRPRPPRQWLLPGQPVRPRRRPLAQEPTPRRARRPEAANGFLSSVFARRSRCGCRLNRLAGMSALAAVTVQT